MQSNTKGFFCLQKAGALARVVTKEEHSNKGRITTEKSKLKGGGGGTENVKKNHPRSSDYKTGLTEKKVPTN